MEQEMVKKEFWRFLEQVRDDRSGVSASIEFLNTLLRNKKCVPPTVEIITVLKNEKPILFRILRQSIPHNSSLRMLLYLEMDYEQAKQRLQLNNDSTKANRFA